MNKYQKIYTEVSDLSYRVNNINLMRLFEQYKKMLQKEYDYKDINNSLCIATLLNDYSTFNDSMKRYISENILDRLNIYSIYMYMTMYLGLSLINDDEKKTHDKIKSYIELGLVSNIQINSGNITITLFNKDSLSFFYPLDTKEDILLCNRNCHDVTSEFMWDKNAVVDDIVITMQNREIYGKFYHSFFVANGIAYDYAHNIAIPYNDYVKLFNPEVIVYEPREEVKENIRILSSQKDFAKCKYVDVLKYGISRQLKQK